MRRGLLLLISVVLHFVAIGVIIYAFLPLAQWYFDNPTLPAAKEHDEAKPLWGVDFYYTVTLTRLLKDNFVLPPVGWGYQWFTGWPLLSSYPILHYYLIVSLTHFFDLISAVKIWMIVSLGLFFIGLYAVFHILSRNIIVSAVLSIAAIYSVGVYGTLMWGGSLPNHATQAFLPWIILFIILYLKKQINNYLLIASFLAGLAIWGHPQIVIAYVYPFASLLFLFSFGTTKFWLRVKSLLLFLFTSFVIGLPLLYSSMGAALQSLVVTSATEAQRSTAKTPSDTAIAIEAFHKAQPFRIYIDTNTTIFFLLIISFILFTIFFIFKNRTKRLFDVFPYIILALFSTAYIWIFSYGISIYHGGWYRLFWAVPFWIGMLAASLWGSWQKQLAVLIKKKTIYFASYIFISFFILVAGFITLNYYSKGVKDKIIPRSNPSSAYPDILNLSKFEEFKQLKSTLIPPWIDGDNTQYRLYAGDQTINIWWSSLYKMPLARGYFDPPVSAANKGYFFLVDAALSQSGVGEDQLVETFNYPEQIALNNTLYFVDWYAIKYIESGPTMAAFTPLPASFHNNTYIKRDERIDSNRKKYNKGDMSLHYYEISDAYTSQILSATNAQALGIIASDIGYETILRGIADMNVSSKQVIPIKLGQYIDKLATSDLSAMDGLIVYDYKYSNKENAFRLLTDYVKKGGKIFIDTGAEVKEASTADALPEIFPVEKTVRKPLGRSWDFELVDKELTAGADFSKFDPPLFDKAPWNISYPPQKEDIRDGANIILKNHDVPVLISYSVGDGLIIWSGVNLPYHVIRSHNVEEVNFFRNIIGKLADEIEKSSKVPIYETEFINPQKRSIAIQGAKGILFKEQAYPGWNAKLTSGRSNQTVKIYKAGPAYPGFMYVRLPENTIQQEAKATFSYSGSVIAWIVSIISFLLVIFIMEEALFNGILLGRLRRQVLKKLHMYVNTWWKREDE